MFNQDTQGLRVRKDSVSIQAEVELTLRVLPTAIPGGEDPQTEGEVSPNGAWRQGRAVGMEG